MPPPTRFRPPGPLGFGGAPLGNMFGRIEEADADAALNAAWDCGVRYFDTAPHYGGGLSEHRFGRVLRDRARDDFALSTKVGRLLHPDEAARTAGNIFVGGLPFRGDYDYSADGARRSIEDSLQRMGMTRIDVAFIHDIAADHHGAGWEALFDQAMRGAARALTRLREEKVIRAWGLGVNLVEPCRRALEQADPDLFLLAGRYSLLDHGHALEALLPQCLERGVGVVVGGPYNSGLTAGGAHFEYREPRSEEIAARDRLAAIANRHGVDLRAAALQFCAAHPAVAAVVPGSRSAERMRQNAELMRQPLPSGFWEEAKRSGAIAADAPVPPG